MAEEATGYPELHVHLWGWAFMYTACFASLFTLHSPASSHPFPDHEAICAGSPMPPTIGTGALSWLPYASPVYSYDFFLRRVIHVPSPCILLTLLPVYHEVSHSLPSALPHGVLPHYTSSTHYLAQQSWR
jgi:hypothetical protein